MDRVQMRRAYKSVNRILAEAGYSAAEISELRDAGVVR
jgi:hypothetical protein